MDHIRRIIFICTGNICRSPMALGFARREAAERRIAVELGSAGTGALKGSAASRNAVEACAERDIDISAHRAAQIDPAKDTPDTLYVCMTAQHMQWLHRVAGIDPKRLVLLGSGVPDPYGGDINVYRRTRDIIEMELREFFDQYADLFRIKAQKQERPAAAVQPSLPAESDTEPDLMPVVVDMQENDLPDVAEIERRCFGDPWSESALADSLDDPCARMLVALYGGAVCGYVCIMLTDDNGYIPRVCVRPAYRRRGVATCLMDAAEAAAKVFGCTAITLEVRESNSAAIALYESLGYRPLGKRPGFYTDPIEAAVVMSKPIDQWEDSQ